MRRSTADLAGEVAALHDLSREQLATTWQGAHGHPAPKGIRQELLARSASWHLQAKRLGGLSPNTKRLLKVAMADAEAGMQAKRRLVASAAISSSDNVSGCRAGHTNSHIAADEQSSSKRPRTTVSPGARLIRDWNGKTHVVDVIEEGFVFQAKVHKSLTAIAHEITGAHWSGPRFFGL